MRPLLAGASLLVLMSSAASADITVWGTARMGLLDTFGDTGPVFTDRIRVNFDMGGETDSGIAFGASVRADNADEANDTGAAGSVFASGAFGKLSMGDVDSAAIAAIGQVDGVGLTGLGDLNELTFIGEGGASYNDSASIGPDDTQDPSFLYEFSAGSFTFYGSSTQLNATDGGQALAVAGKYAAGAYTVAFGYESLDAEDEYHWEQYVLGGTASFGPVTVRATIADGQNNQGSDWSQYAVSATYKADVLSVTGFVASDEELTVDDLGNASTVDGYGLGATYDLGGGAAVKGGYARNQTTDEQAVDVGLNFSF
jgi:outer membrane protein OmpU